MEGEGQQCQGHVQELSSVGWYYEGPLGLISHSIWGSHLSEASLQSEKRGPTLVLPSKSRN